MEVPELGDEDPDVVGHLAPTRSRSLQDMNRHSGRVDRSSTPVANLKPTTGSGKLLFDMVRFPDHTFSLVPHDDVVYKRIRYSSDSNIYDRQRQKQVWRMLSLQKSLGSLCGRNHNFW